MAGAMEVEVERVCAHHWLIEAPSADKSRGTCKLCGAVRDFLNEPATAFHLAPKKRPITKPS